MKSKSLQKELSPKNIQLIPVSIAHEDLFCSLYTDSQVMKFIGPVMSDQKAKTNFQSVLRLSQQPRPNSIYRVIVVLDNKGQIECAGFVRLKTSEPSDIGIIGVMLKPEFEGQSLAFLAQRILIRKYEENGYFRSFSAYCRQDNKRAHALYKRLGFHKAQQLIYNGEQSILWQRGY